jgi:D-threo-aldose 1-dehydrogenase
VPLAAAVLQFSMRDLRITSTIVGVSRLEQVNETVRLASWDVPEQLWEKLDPLAAPQHLWQW